MNIKPILTRIRWDTMANKTQQDHIQRLFAILNAISTRFSGIIYPEQIRLKHCRWIKTQWFSDQQFSVATQKDYIRTLTLLIEALDKAEHWLPALGMAPNPAVGGRPRKAAVVKSKKYYR
ncbi:hypothetical protein [Marinobacterium rhizophilum]|uniref:hypothetical protein n=1 Tax=Marinobacterium rhizophilum TaxID=420402 RepID=UPI000362DA7E|nr:hypothetical protein [Marinobacterium rhizophilum]